MDPVTVGLVLGLIERAVVLAPQVVSLVRRVANGEKISQAEIEATMKLHNDAVSRWDAAGKKV